MTYIFDNINDRNKAKLLQFLEADTLHFKKDISIFPMIKNDNVIGIITTGCIQIIRIDKSGSRTIIDELEEQEVFGSTISSLKNNEYDIITKEDTVLILIDYKNIINCPLTNKEFFIQFMKNLLEIVTFKNQEKNERIEILTKKTIRNKLLEYFNIISKKHGTKYIYLPFNFTDLADYLAIDRSAMSRELKYLKEEGLIEVKGKRIKLLYDQN